MNNFLGIVIFLLLHLNVVTPNDSTRLLFNTSMKLKQFWTVLGAVCINFPGLFAQNSTHEFGIKSENDAYLANGRDGYYTNGFFLQYRYLSKRQPAKTGLNKKIYEIELGQKMFTSHSGYVYDRRYVDRSITAYLYLGGSINWFYNSEKTMRIGMQIGTIGPAALGRQVQEGFHKITNTYAPNCWKYQLNNEPGLNMNIGYSQLMHRTASEKIDLIGHAYANLGNTFTGMGLGFTLRTGRLNQLFQSTTNRSVISGPSDTAPPLNKSELFIFVKPQLDLSIYDATISGGLFIKDKGPIVFDAKPWVMSQEMGLMFSKKNFSAQISYIFKSPEAKGNMERNRFGSVSTNFRF